MYVKFQLLLQAGISLVYDILIFSVFFHLCFKNPAFVRVQQVSKIGSAFQPSPITQCKRIEDLMQDLQIYIYNAFGQHIVEIVTDFLNYRQVGLIPFRFMYPIRTFQIDHTDTEVASQDGTATPSKYIYTCRFLSKGKLLSKL